MLFSTESPLGLVPLVGSSFVQGLGMVPKHLPDRSRYYSLRGHIVNITGVSIPVVGTVLEAAEKERDGQGRNNWLPRLGGHQRQPKGSRECKLVLILRKTW